MSKEVSIFVGNERLDLYEGVKIPLNFNISDVSEINKRAGSYSKTIKIPATANNNRILGYGNELNSRFRDYLEPQEDKVIETLEAGALTQIVKETTRVVSNGLTIFEGFIKPLGGTINKDGCYSEYSVNIYSDNNDWVSVAKDKKLADLDWSNFNHQYNKATIDFKETLGGFFPDVLYPLINFGKFGGGGGSIVTVEDRIPAWNVKTVLQNIFTEQGYTIDSDFVDSDFFKKLYVPALGRFELTDEQVDNLSFIAHDTGWTTTDSTNEDSTYLSPIFSGINWQQNIINRYTSEELGASDFNQSTGVYTFSEPSAQKFKYSGTFVPETLFISTTFKVWFTISKIPISSPSTTITLASKEVDAVANGIPVSFSIETGVVDFEIGDKVFVLIHYAPGQQAAINSIKDTTFENEVSKNILEDSNLQFQNLVPDVTQLEFIQSLTQLFNLYFYADINTKTIYIEPRDEFYFDTNTTLDWSSKVDNNKNCDIKYLGDNLKKNIRYRYKEDGNDEWVDYWEYQNNDVYASHTETIKNEFTSGTGDKENKLFAPTYMEEDRDIGFVNTKIPKLWQDVPDGNDKPAFSNDFEPRILYFAGTVPTDQGDEWNWDGTIRTEYPKFYSLDEDNGSNDNSLNFDDNSEGLGLFNKHYQNTQKLINYGRKVTMYLNLTDLDIINFDFRTLVYIDGSYYYVESIKDYDTTEKQTTKVELLTLVDLTTVTTQETARLPRNTALRNTQRRGRLTTTGDRDNNIEIGTETNTNGFSRSTLIGRRIRATNNDQVVIGNGDVSEGDVAENSSLVIAGTVVDCDTGVLEDKPLLQFDRAGNMIVGQGYIYTTTGEIVLSESDPNNLTPIRKDNINS